MYVYIYKYMYIYMYVNMHVYSYIYMSQVAARFARRWGLEVAPGAAGEVQTQKGYEPSALSGRLGDGTAGERGGAHSGEGGRWEGGGGSWRSGRSWRAWLSRARSSPLPTPPPEQRQKD